jgi:iron complex outermembrane recepter protein
MVRGHLSRSASSAAIAAIFLSGMALPSFEASAQTAPQPAASAPDPAIAGVNPPSPSPYSIATSPSGAAMADPAGKPGNEIVVTGTLIRGVAPVGTNVVSLGRANILATGATNAADLLGQIPQVSNTFNTTPSAGGDLGSPIVRPNIRNLANAGGQTTLVLLNGHRMVNLGVVQTAPDPAAIPVSALERVEVVPDGGSSIYGSDAIGGVINFITRRRMNGIEFNSQYGVGDHYHEYDLNGAVGKDWGTGSLVLAYEYNHHDDILGIHRGYVSQYRPDEGGSDFRSNQCSPGNVIANGISYALPQLTPGANLCDTSDYSSIYPRETKQNAYGSLTQDLNDWLRFNAELFWSRRLTTTFYSQNSTNATIDATNPYFRGIAGETSQTVAFDYTPVSGNSRVSRSLIESFGITPAFTAKLGGDWQVRVQGNYGRSYTEIREPTANRVAEAAALAGTTLTTALDPYDIAATNSDVIANILNYENYADGTQELAEGRVVANGTLLHRPGGAVHVAAGGEYHFENFSGRSTGAPIGQGALLPSTKASRDVKSVFGEVVVPIFGQDNGFAGMRRLDLSASVRYDSYNDVGSTTNPKFGLTWKPVNSLTIRGNYGTSFNAPSLVDFVAATDTRAQVLQNSPYLRGDALPSDAVRRTILIAGGNKKLDPQTAHTYSIGGDFKPDFAPGLTLSATYYNVHLKNLIGLVPFSNTSQIFQPAYADYVTLNPTLAQAQTLLSGLRLDGISSIAALYASGQGPYAIFDARRYNLGSVNTDGIDFNVTYNRRTGFGSIDANVGGTYTLDRKSRPIAGADEVNELKLGGARLSLLSSIGATVGKAGARLQWIHSPGFEVDLPGQTHVKSFEIFNLFLSYDLGDIGFMKGVALTLNIDNLFDRDPSFANNAGGRGNGATLGRVAKFGLRTKF